MDNASTTTAAKARRYPLLTLLSLLAKLTMLAGAISIPLQVGFIRWATGLVIGVVALLVLATLWRVRVKPAHALLLWVIGISYSLLVTVQGASTGRDISCLALAVAVMLTLDPHCRDRWFGSLVARPKSYGMTARDAANSAALFAVTLWLFLSTADYLIDDGVSPLGSRSLKVAASMPTSLPHVESPAISLTLSGGGYRAALFHAGVLSELRDARVRIQALTSVSGGSIIGAYYSRGGEPEQFVWHLSMVVST